MSEQPASITTTAEVMGLPDPPAAPAAVQAPAPVTPAAEPSAPAPTPATPRAGQIRGFVRHDPISGRQVVGLGIVLEVGESAVVLVPLPSDRVLVDVDSLTG